MSIVCFQPHNSGETDTCLFMEEKFVTQKSSVTRSKLLRQQKQSQASNPGLLMPKPAFFLVHHSCHLELGKSFILFFCCFSLDRNSFEN